MYLVSCSSGKSKDEITPVLGNIEEIIVGKTWKLLDIDYGWVHLNTNNTYLTKDYLCDTLEQFGTWELDENVLVFTYIIAPIEYIERHTIIELSDTLIKIQSDTSATLDVNILFELVLNDVIRGCMDSTYANYNPNAQCPDTCTQGGCTDPTACNYNPIATEDDGSCIFPDGCTDPTACNYDPTAQCDDGSCQLPDGCTDPTACNYDPTATCDDGSCQLPDGCTDSIACNYNPLAVCDDGSCQLPDGCTDPTAYNYDPTAQCDDGSCIYLTYIPDDNFEQRLIDLGYDNVLDDYVTTANINTLTYLNLNARLISDLTGIEDFIALEELNCSENQLTSLDVSQNIALTNLNCSATQLTSLDVSQNTALVSLSCGGGLGLTILDVTNNTSLTTLKCYGTRFSSIDLSQNTALIELVLTGDQYNPAGTMTQGLDLSNHPALESITVLHYELNWVDLRNGNNSNISLLVISDLNQNCIYVDNIPPIFAPVGLFQVWNAPFCP